MASLIVIWALGITCIYFAYLLQKKHERVKTITRYFKNAYSDNKSI